MLHPILSKILPLALGWLSFMVLFPVRARAHGESVRGAGSRAVNTVGGVPANSLWMGVRYDYRQYARFSDAQLLRFRAMGEDVHQHSSEQTVFLSLGVPLGRNVDLTFVLPDNQFRGFKDNGDEFVDASCPIVPGSGSVGDATARDCISTTKTSTGLGDLLGLVRWRFFHRGPHNIAGVFGLSVPTGRIRARVDKVNPDTGRRELVGTHNQAGSGAFALQLGVAHASRIDRRFGVSSDVVFHVNGEGAYEFRRGNGFQADVAFSFGKPHAVFVPVLEYGGIFQLRDIEDGEIKRNSGGSVVYASPGFLIQLGRHLLYGSFSLPVWQRLGGISNNELWCFAVGYGVGLDVLRPRARRGNP